MQRTETMYRETLKMRPARSTLLRIPWRTTKGDAFTTWYRLCQPCCTTTKVCLTEA